MKTEKSNSCPFCEIAEGRANAYIVYDHGPLMAILDTKPLFPGHVLLLPKKHIPTFMDLPDELLEPLARATRLLSKAVKIAMHSEGIFIANNNIVSQRVPHLHIHIVPRNKGDGLIGFFWPRTKYSSQEEMEKVASAIRNESEKLLLEDD